MTGPTPSGKAQSGLSRRVQTAGVRRTLALATHMDVHTPVDIGTDFLGYRIEELIGRGGMGVVYRANDLRLRRPVAIKLVAPALALDERFRERFARETELVMSLEHPNVVPIYDAGDLVPDDLMIELIRERLSAPDTSDGFILDGFPRNVAQADALDRMLEEIDRELTVVLHFQVPDELVVERLHVRALQEGRTDDTPDIIRHRLEVFHQQTEPVVEYYRSKGILVGIHADRPIDAVFAEVQEVLETASTRQ